MALWYKAYVARVSRIVRVDGFQPVVVCLGTCLQARYQQRSLLCADGVARNGFAAGNENPCDRIAGYSEGYDVASLDRASHQSAVG